MKKFNNKSGFTLIEIIVVLIIVGILAAIALPSLFSNVTKSKGAEAVASMGPIKASLEACLVKNAGAEDNCSAGNVGLPINNANFTYALTTAPTVAAPTYVVTATNTGTLVGTVTLTKSPAGVISCAGTGGYLGVC